VVEGLKGRSPSQWGLSLHLIPGSGQAHKVTPHEISAVLAERQESVDQGKSEGRAGRENESASAYRGGSLAAKRPRKKLIRKRQPGSTGESLCVGRFWPSAIAGRRATHGE